VGRPGKGGVGDVVAGCEYDCRSTSGGGGVVVYTDQYDGVLGAEYGCRVVGVSGSVGLTGGLGVTLPRKFLMPCENSVNSSAGCCWSLLLLLLLVASISLPLSLSLVLSFFFGG
jgi:hypothetical protein